MAGAGDNTQAGLGKLADTLRSEQTRISQLLRDDPGRVQRYSVNAAGVHLDYSRHLLADQALQSLLSLAEECQVEQALSAMFAGDVVNPTERRSALHVALRGHVPDNCPEAANTVSESLARMQKVVDAVRDGSWKGAGGDRITDVVNLGIGGSDLGPHMIAVALRRWQSPGLRSHFVSNVDPVHLHETLDSLDPASTLFLVASKSFTTLETMENARRARAWLQARFTGTDAIRRHFLAISSRPDRAIEFGIPPENVLPMQDWTGGRFSLWSTIGLPIALATGMHTFRELLDGAHDMDRHALESPLAQNMPVIMALLAFWYSRAWHCQTHAVLPYSQSLHLFPAWLQQLEMESLGKSIDISGRPVDGATGQIIWGSAGTNGQHSFHQLLHQGTTLVPVDFIAIAQGHLDDCQLQHQQLLANCLAQSQALMQGNTRDEIERDLLDRGMSADHARLLAPHKVVPGNRPSSTLLLPSLTPRTLGALVALYEHKVYVQSILCHINAFDQWGVEIGKALSGPVLNALETGELPDNLDASTSDLIQRCRSLQSTGTSEQT